MNIRFVQDMFDNILGKGQKAVSDKAYVDSSPAEVIGWLHTLKNSDDEVSHISLAKRILDAYQFMEDGDKKEFFTALSTDFPADVSAIDAAVERYQQTGDYADLGVLHRTCEPPQQELLRRLNTVPGRTYEIVKMRSDHIRLMKGESTFKPLDADFLHLFSSWFNRGFLTLNRIDWNTPAAVLEKIIAYEAVHQIQDWDDLRRRLESQDRRCFAFFHPATGDEPLIFVEVALTQGIPSSISGILSGEERPEGAPDTAAFYGISNCQSGLRGVSFGNLLIKQVVQELMQELPQLKNFVTTSPVPGFSKWVQQHYNEPEEGDSSISQEAQKMRHAMQVLQESSWLDSPELIASVAEDVKHLAAVYLVHEKRGQGPANAVARFHLGNGAKLHRINWPGDLTKQGCKEWHGLMVNYLYELDAIEQNHEAFMSQHTIVTSPEVEALAEINK